MISVVKIGHPVLGGVNVLTDESGGRWIDMDDINHPRYSMKYQIRVYIDKNNKVWVSLDKVNANLDFGYRG